jgi:transcriptional regulator with XRE-family HTH domain
MRGIIVDGRRLREIRAAAGMTQRELATLAGVAERTVRHAEAGRRVRADFLSYLAKSLGVALSELAGDHGELRVAQREQRRVALILEAIAARIGEGSWSQLVELLTLDARVVVPGPEVVPICGEFRGADGIHRLNDRSLVNIDYNAPPAIHDIRSQGNLVVINGLDRLRAIPTGKSFTTPWMNVYEFERDRLVRIDMWADTHVAMKAFQPD